MIRLLSAKFTRDAVLKAATAIVVTIALKNFAPSRLRVSRAFNRPSSRYLGFVGVSGI